MEGICIHVPRHDHPNLGEGVVSLPLVHILREHHMEVWPLGSQLLCTSASQLDKLRVANAEVRCVAPVIHGGELDAVPPIPLDKVALHPVPVRPQLVQHAPELHGKVFQGGVEVTGRVRPVAVPLRVLALLQRVQHVISSLLGCLCLNYINAASYQCSKPHSYIAFP